MGHDSSQVPIIQLSHEQDIVVSLLEFILRNKDMAAVIDNTAPINGLANR